MLPYASVDPDFLKTLNIRVTQGRNFDPQEKTDSLLPYIINKRAAVELGWVDDPLNKTIEIFAPGTTKIMAKGIVIGVMEDFHFESLHKPVKPVIFTVDSYHGTILVRMQDVNPSNLDRLSSIWKEFSPKPFQYEMMDKQLEKLYTNETQLSKVIQFFTIIALYLTCYGLFAMSSLLFSSRLREVAIRKVLGADRWIIIRELYSRYALFNLIAIIAGVPAAVYLGNLWLSSFQYKIDLNPGFFLKAASLVLFAGLVSVGFYLGKVALSNPVKFLRRD
jgi:putative ABC transport system permease protein